MNSKKNLCQSWKLYIITDFSNTAYEQLFEKLERAMACKADVVQLRHKTASDEEMISLATKIKSLVRYYGKTFIVNDRIDICKAVMADGLHLGQEDGALLQAREFLPKEMIFGRSTHSPSQAQKALEEGFDYIGVGPVFQTPTKPDYQPVGLEYVEYVSKHIDIPFVAIGGIDIQNVAKVRAAGAKCVAVVRQLMSTQNLEETVKKLIGE